MRASTTSARALRAAFLTVVMISVVSGVLGCGLDAGLRDRYVAERLAWQAAKGVNAMRSNPGLATDETREHVRGIYEEIVRRFPPPEDPAAMTDTERDIASIAARSRLELADMQLADGNDGEAVRLYDSVRLGYSYERELGVEASIALAETHEAFGRWEEAVAAYERLTTDWPPAADESAVPDARILRAPFRIAAGYRARGDVGRSRALFTEARRYYDEWAARWPESGTALVAAGFGAETFLVEERWGEAVDAYEALDERFGDDRNRPSILLTIADTYRERLVDEGAARGYYLRIVEAYPDALEAASAALALATGEMAGGDHETARARLSDVVERFSEEEAIRATAIQFLATSYEEDGMWESAAAQFNALAREHPTTMYGLTALQHVAQHYREAGEDAAAEVALAKAADHYERVIRDYASTPAELAARGYLIDTRIRQERWDDATRVLVETAERFPKSESSPPMLFQAADIYENRLEDTEAAVRVLEQVRRQYEGTRAAEEAERALEGLR